MTAAATPVRNLVLLTALMSALYPVPARAQRVPTQQPAASMVPPMDAKQEKAGWLFSNSQEFPGATGSLTLDATATRDGRASLKLAGDFSKGDFSKGGNYVAATAKIPNVHIRELSLWIRNPDSDQLTLGIDDGSGQTHQIVFRTEQSPDW